MESQLEKRLDRFESKLDTLNDVLVQLAVLQDNHERYTATIARLFDTFEKHEAQMQKLEERQLALMEKLEARIGQLENQQIKNNQKLDFATKMFWGITLPLLSAVAYMLVNG